MKKQPDLYGASVLPIPYVPEPSQRPCGAGEIIVPISEIWKMKTKRLCNMLKTIQ